MKITNIRASLHDVPVTPVLFDTARTSWQIVFCEVDTDDGPSGFGITGRMLPSAIVAVLEKEMLPVVKGMDPRDTEAIHAAVWQRLNPRAYTGVISNALSAFDIALWDIHGKATGRTVAQLLGGYRNWAPTYVTFGLASYDRDQLVEVARRFVAEGHNGLKMVVGRAAGGWREDTVRVRSVREAIGPDVALMIDANYKFTPPDARALCRAVEDCDITFFEEPLHQNDARALADLRRHTRIPIAAGQMEGHRWRYRELVEHQAVDILQPNCCYNGGYTETRKVAHLAQAFNLPIDNGGGFPAFNMHTMAGLMNGEHVEYHQITAKVCEAVFKGVPRPQNNRITIPERPGLGFEPDYDALRDCVIPS